MSSGFSIMVSVMPLITGPESTPFWVRFGTRGLTSIKLSNSSGSAVTATKQSPILVPSRPGMGRLRYSWVGTVNVKGREIDRVGKGAAFGRTPFSAFIFHFLGERTKPAAYR